MIIRLLPLIPDDTKIDFFGHRYLGLLFSAIIIIGTVFFLSTRGLNLGIDFTGGTLMEVSTPVEADIPQLREKLSGLGSGEIIIQEFGTAKDLMLRLPQQEGGPEVQKAAIDRVRAALDAEFAPETVEYRRVEYVGPQVGDELKWTAFWAMLASIAGVLAYVWFRFEWQYGLGSILALLHDVIATLGIFAVTQMPFDLATFGAILLVAGYSINDTVIIYDRIRENLRKYKKMPVGDIINLSINQTLNRTVMTSASTLLALLALWIWGGHVIQSFVAALFLGIAIGVHSSYFIAAPILDYLNLRGNKSEDNGDEAANGLNGAESQA